MAERKSSLLAKSVQKHAGRAKEKFLQNLGKVDRTADEIFDEHLTNFNRQQTNATKLQKEFNNYIRCIRAVQTASKTLMDAICDVYETPWSGAEALHAQVSAIEVLWQDFSHKLADQVLIPLNTYTAQFPEMKKKIEKRNRKLIDYDGQRHSFQNLQANAAKRRDDKVITITKGRDSLDEARRTYEILNTELHDELPALHDSRILFLVTNLQTLFASEQVFHNETSKVFAELEAIVDKLATDSQRGSYTLKRISDSNQTSQPSSPTKLNSLAPVNNSYPNSTITNGNSNPNSPSSPPSSPSSSNVIQPQSSHDNSLDDDDDDSGSPIRDTEPSYENTSVENMVANTAAPPAPTAVRNSSPKTNKNNANVPINKMNNNGISSTSERINGNVDNSSQNDTVSSTDGVASATAVAVTTGATAAATIVTSTNKSNNNRMEELFDIPMGATTTDLPPGVLYRVKATYKYVKEDADELSFEVGDTIRVIEYDDPEDQEEGWLMGIKEGSTEKGLFPANFTRPL